MRRPLVLVLAVAVLGVCACGGSPPTPATAASNPTPDSPTAAPAAPAPAASAAPKVPEIPDEVVAANRAAFDACYAQARSLDPKLGMTKVEAIFVVDADGKTTTVDFKYRNKFDDKAKDCICATQAWPFTSPRGCAACRPCRSCLVLELSQGSA